MTPSGGRHVGRLTLAAMVVIGFTMAISAPVDARAMLPPRPHPASAESVQDTSALAAPAHVDRPDVGRPVAAADSVDAALKTDARRFGWPLAIGLLVVAFLAFQHRAERHERKLADAPLDQGERLRFR